MKRSTMFGFAALLAAASCGPLQADSSPPGLSSESSIENLLDALDQVGQGLKDFTADVALTTEDSGTGQSDTAKGHVWYALGSDGQAKVRVSFNSKRSGKRIDDKYHQEYLLADGWLTDRDYRTKHETRRQVLKPGQKVNLLKLGEGPFPLPIGQKKEDVLANFTAEKAKPETKSPPNTVYLKLTPKPDTSFARKFKAIGVWVDCTSHMPARIETTEKSGTPIRTTDLSSVKINGGVKPSDFELEKIDTTWDTSVEPFKE